MNKNPLFFNSIIIFALTLNVGFVYGGMDDVSSHHVNEYFVVLLMNIVAMVIKFGDDTEQGKLLLSTSIVAVIQLIAGSILWGVGSSTFGWNEVETLHSVLGMAVGALTANLISVYLILNKVMKHS